MQVEVLAHNYNEGSEREGIQRHSRQSFVFVVLHESLYSVLSLAVAEGVFVGAFGFRLAVARVSCSYRSFGWGKWVLQQVCSSFTLVGT